MIVNTVSYNRCAVLQSQLDSLSQKSFTQYMALRVLLADESATIKKVFQLALQDFAVEVVTVNVGIDVLTVAERIKPDIIFADVLLQKKSGYDVSLEIKHHSELENTPVVLIWSGFMDLDDDKYQASKADGHLEKPFDAQKLRKLLQHLVPKTKTQELSEYLTFPNMPEFDEAQSLQTPPPAPNLEQTPSKSTEADAGTWTQTSSITAEPTINDEVANSLQNHSEEFQEVSIPKNETHHTEQESDLTLLQDDPEDEMDNQWVQRPISSYKLGVDPGSTEEKLEVDFNIPQQNMEKDYAMPAEGTNPDLEVEIDIPPSYENTPSPRKDETPPNLAAMGFNKDDLEALITAEVKKVVDDVVWKVVPELASQLIQKEINRLLSENELTE